MSHASPILAFQGQISGDNYFSGICPFCQTACRLLTKEFYYSSAEQIDHLAVCLSCGWWSYSANQAADLNGNSDYYSSRALLREFAVSDMDVPYRELAKYLNKHHDQIYDVAPAKFEELVASIYRDVLGSSIEFCSYGRPDRGIDVICARTEPDCLFGIQVKRYKCSIELGQIHQFLGALQLSKLGKGVFVTSSRFQRGCYEVIKQSSDLLGIEIDLVDGRQLLDFIGILNKKPDQFYCRDWSPTGYNGAPSAKKEGIPFADLQNAPIWPGG